MNLLGKDQQWIAERMATFHVGDDRFNGIDWDASDATRCPILAGAVAHIDCVLHEVHPAGDHNVYIGLVIAAQTNEPAIDPLTYFRSTYT